MIEKLKTLLWFSKRINYWRHALALFARKFYVNKDTHTLRFKATQWASNQHVSVEEALISIGLSKKNTKIEYLSKSLIKEAQTLAKNSKVVMGGAGDLDLLFAASKLSKANKALETGVAYGWSSLAILESFSSSKNSKLISIDMPYPKMNNEDFVGIVVPEYLKAKWSLIKEPDRNGIKKALKKFGGTIDFCHYDSDKSYYGRRYAYPILWKALKNKGIFISDDIQDNFAFKEFVEIRKLNFAVTKSAEKYIGIVYKN
jgi:predicted O-methyltransferase YrrM